jgi:hypothetical protein
VTFQYLEVESGRNSLVAGKSATVGLEDASGSIAAKYTFNGNPALVTNQQALVFVPYGSNPSAPSLTGASFAAGQFDCTLFAAPRQACVIEASSDLAGWLALKTNTVPASGMMSFSEPVAGQPHRFYRARAQ